MLDTRAAVINPGSKTRSRSPDEPSVRVRGVMGLLRLAASNSKRLLLPSVGATALWLLARLLARHACAFLFFLITAWTAFIKLARCNQPWDATLLAALAPRDGGPTALKPDSRREVRDASVLRRLRKLAPPPAAAAPSSPGEPPSYACDLGLPPIDGALLVTGATGFVGGNLMYAAPPSPYLPCTFPVPSPYLPCIFG